MCVNNLSKVALNSALNLQSQVQRPNHCATEPHKSTVSHTVASLSGERHIYYTCAFCGKLEEWAFQRKTMKSIKAQSTTPLRHKVITHLHGSARVF